MQTQTMPSNQNDIHFHDNICNFICKFQCNRCQKFKHVLKKVADQQQHGFACEECWTAIEKRSRYSGCTAF